MQGVSATFGVATFMVAHTYFHAHLLKWYVVNGFVFQLDRIQILLH